MNKSKTDWLYLPLGILIGILIGVIIFQGQDMQIWFSTFRHAPIAHSIIEFARILEWVALFAWSWIFIKAFSLLSVNLDMSEKEWRRNQLIMCALIIGAIILFT